jgi:3-oxoacyl-[acyl-carrier-protein] synthase II
MPRRDVVITGLGPVTAFGPGMDVLWDALVAGRSAIARIRAFDPVNFPCQVAAEMPEGIFDVRQIVPKSYRKATKVMCRDVELAVGAAAAAVEDARLITRAVDPDAAPTFPPARLGCHIGAGLIAADVRELAEALITSRGADGSVDLRHWGRAGMANLTPLWLLKYLPNMLACHVTIVHGCRGPSNTITCCEASSGLSFGESMRVIERGAADACLTGGAEYKLNMMAFLRQEFTGRLAPSNGTHDPASVVRPFDPDARGTVLGEGGGILVVEAADVAADRGARVYARIAGFATTQSFCPDTVGLDVPPEDPSLADAIDGALRDGDVAPDQIDAIVPFGSGVPALDAAEAQAIKRVFGARSGAIPLVTTVPNVGCCAAGNGAIALCVAARSLYEQMLPARLSSRGAKGLDAAAAPARGAPLRHALVFTPSQGGQNVAVVLARGETRNGRAA